MNRTHIVAVAAAVLLFASAAAAKFKREKSNTKRARRFYRDSLPEMTLRKV